MALARAGRKVAAEEVRTHDTRGGGPFVAKAAHKSVLLRRNLPRSYDRRR